MWVRGRYGKTRRVGFFALDRTTIQIVALDNDRRSYMPDEAWRIGGTFLGSYATEFRSRRCHFHQVVKAVAQDGLCRSIVIAGHASFAGLDPIVWSQAIQSIHPPRQPPCAF
jgi:hypothetical protein